MQSYLSRVPQLTNRIDKLKQSLPHIKCPTEQNSVMDNIAKLMNERETAIDEKHKQVAKQPEDETCEACQ